ALAFSNATTCASVSRRPSWALLASSALSRLAMVSRSWRSHTRRTTEGDTVRERLRNSLATPTWPKAGCSSAIATTASSTSCGTRFFGSCKACALAHKACRDDRSVLYHRVPRLLDALALARGDGRYARLLKSLARVELLILDDWGLSPMTADQRRDLLEILEDRHGRGSTIV